MKKKYLIFFLFIFFVSGFSGLIYESIWTHYLKLYLGHAAYAQTLVLTIFMGGMAMGSYLASRYSEKWKRLFLSYALVEIVIGILALVFHQGFVSFLEISFNSVFPDLGSYNTVNLYKWVTAAYLILPQSVLLGTTFPLMSAAIIRAFPDSPGKKISLLYFTNSLGAAIGVLVSGFYFINAFGLPGTIQIAGVLNIGVALAVIFLSRKNEEGSKKYVFNATGEVGVPKNLPAVGIVLLSVSALTGMASFIYEIGWIRMLNMVLGTSTHAFELMLSSFIFGLAFGGLWIRNRIDRMSNPTAYLGYVQLIMGAMALSTLWIYGNTFNWMQWLLQILEKDDTGYLLFNLSSNGIALLVMFPTTFCAGMTLPIITTILLKVKGERSIGAVYAWNTVGAIAGVIVAVYFGMPLLGLKGLIGLGAGIDIALGILLLFSFSKVRSKYSWKTIGSLGAILVLSGTMLFVELDTLKMGSGVYRGRDALFSPEENKVLFHQDGKTASISVIEHQSLDGMLSIRTNGKTDATLYKDLKPLGTIDESTMVQLAVIPMALHPEAEHVVNIGLGAGITTRSVLLNPRIKSIHSIEIEEEVVHAAEMIRDQIGEVLEDPRSKIVIDDAKSFFSSGQQKFDIILSEPSNPWVSGVSGLFSEEFYKMINLHLTEEGVFAQWLQLYNVDMDLVVSVLKAVSNNFADYKVYALNQNECLIVAKKTGLLPSIDEGVVSLPEIAKALEHVSVNNDQDIAFRLIGNKRIMDPFIRRFSIPANSDYYPVLDQNATRHRFIGSKAYEIYSFSHQLHNVVSMLTGEEAHWETTEITPSPFFYTMSVNANEAIALRDFYLYDDFELHYKYLPEKLREESRIVKSAFGKENKGAGKANRLVSFFYSSIRMMPYLTPKEMEKVWQEIGIMEDPTLTEEEQSWLRLFLAVIQKDSTTMVQMSEYLLANAGEGLNGYPKEYLLSSLMLGHLKLNYSERARKAWYLYGNNLTEDPRSKMLFQFLVSQIESQE